MKPEILVLCTAIESDPDADRACLRCLKTMAAPDPGFDATPLCNGCAQITCVDLAAAVRELIVERDAARRDRSAAVKALAEFDAALERRGTATAAAAKRLDLLERKVKRLGTQRPLARKKARR